MRSYSFFPSPFLSSPFSFLLPLTPHFVQVLDAHLLTTPKHSVENKTKLLVELVEIFLHEGSSKDGGPLNAFATFSRLLKDKKVMKTKKKGGGGKKK